MQRQGHYRYSLAPSSIQSKAVSPPRTRQPANAKCFWRGGPVRRHTSLNHIKTAAGHTLLYIWGVAQPLRIGVKAIRYR